jgi:hypothetical protein
MHAIAFPIPVLASILSFSQPSGAQSIDTSILPADRATVWNPGMTAVGGIPVRSTICATLTPNGGMLDDTAQIQTAINACPLGQVVQLAAGTFLINSGNIVMVNKGITLRGAGPNQTTLQKTNGAAPYPAPVSGPNPSPLIIVGTSRWSNTNDSSGAAGSTSLTADAIKGSNAVTAASTTGFSVGQFVLLDEASGAGWQNDPEGSTRGQIWAAPDWRVIWQKHNPALQSDDFADGVFPTTPGSAGQWFSRLDRPTAEVKQIASISGATITFTTPIHISYRVSHFAQLSYYGPASVANAGVENLKIIGGDDGNLKFNWAAQSWAKNIESTVWFGQGVSLQSSFRIELREFYIHDAAWVQPGGGAYAISLDFGTSEVLVEDGISVRTNKVIVARCSGAGSVVGYNYMDMGYINSNGAWIETGINGSHMVGPHHMLFEGNYAFSGDSDNTHGNSIYHTFFRNYLAGVRGSFVDQEGGATIDDASQPSNGPKRAAGPMAYSYWMSFVGNLMGVAGKMSAWLYESSSGGSPSVWMLGWDTDALADPQVAANILRHGNFDYLTNSQIWEPTIANRTIPNSYYLTSKPAFFRNYSWPWVEPSTGAKYTLPAKARYDAGTFFGIMTNTNSHDFNGNALSDIAWRDSGGNIAVWLMSGAAAASSGGLGTVPTTWSIVGQRDFDGDGKADLLWRDISGNTAIWFMNGTQVVSSVGMGNIPSNWSVVATGDFNGDGKGDIFWRDGSGNVAVWLMSGTAVLSSRGLGNVPSTWSVVGTGDFDADGAADLLWRDNLGNTSIWFMSGAQVSSTAGVGNIPTSWSVVGIGDFNGDSFSDIAWRDTSGDTAIWLMNGTAVTAVGGLGAMPTTWSIVQTGDYNGDGHTDLLWRDNLGNTSMWFMNGTTVESTAGVGNIPTNWTVQSVNAE